MTKINNIDRLRTDRKQVGHPKSFRRIADNQRGGVLLFLLVAVTVLGLSAAIAGSTWTSIVQRAREEELLWKGNQIRKAIGTYYETKGVGGAPLTYPRSIDELLEDNRSLNARRHLRRPYLDPMTGQDWEWIRAPQGGIQGVRSTSEKKPFKMDGFSEENKKFAGMWQYRDWEFVYEAKKKSKATSTTTPKTGTATDTNSTTGTQPAGSSPFGTTPPPSGN